MLVWADGTFWQLLHEWPVYVKRLSVVVKTGKAVRLSFQRYMLCGVKLPSGHRYHWTGEACVTDSTNCRGKRFILRIWRVCMCVCVLACVWSPSHSHLRTHHLSSAPSSPDEVKTSKETFKLLELDAAVLHRNIRRPPLPPLPPPLRNSMPMWKSSRPQDALK